jgi:UDP-3-O-[3-hydroxymyristoyl] N-acetylglucosamine deacetylase
MYHTTLCNPCTIEGIGVHTGHTCCVRCLPAPPGQGVRFFCPDPVQASIASVHSVMLSTVLRSVNGSSTVGMVEHMLAACRGLGITDMDVVVDAQEMPILDGSAKKYAQIFQETGLHSSEKPIEWLVINNSLEYADRHSTIRLDPGPPIFHVTVDLGSDYIHHHIYDECTDDFVSDIAPARTFVRLKDVNDLKDKGYIKGGSLDCAVILDGKNIVNPEGLLFDNECARHKILDMMGDFFLLGRPIYGTITARNPGHGANCQALRALLGRSDCFSYEKSTYLFGQKKKQSQSLA